VIKRDFDETGVTNLGLVPKGMTFSEAVASMRDKRKYRINPYDGGHRMTLCDTLRAMWREIDTLPDGPFKEQMRDYLGASFDYAKRMDARMKELKGLLDGCD
jgi:hypothetical protein